MVFEDSLFGNSSREEINWSRWLTMNLRQQKIKLGELIATKNFKREFESGRESVMRMSQSLEVYQLLLFREHYRMRNKSE
jgi:hypothetical protein